MGKNSINSDSFEKTYSEQTEYNFESLELEHSGYWILTNKIHIDNNWSITENTYDWCSGSGTQLNPYLIENVTIDGGGLGSCILIENSDKYFIIRNCTLYNSGSGSSDAGIYLNYVNNGLLINNNCSVNAHGMYLFSCKSNNLTNNKCSRNSENGIYVYFESNSNILSNNNCSSNNAKGIYIDWYSDHNILTNNNCSYNNGDGMYVSRYCDYNTISNNTCSFNDDGMYVIQYCDYNTIRNNTCSFNDFNGINLVNIYSTPTKVLYLKTI